MGHKFIVVLKDVIVVLKDVIVVLDKIIVVLRLMGQKFMVLNKQLEEQQLVELMFIRK